MDDLKVSLDCISKTAAKIIDGIEKHCPILSCISIKVQKKAKTTMHMFVSFLKKVFYIFPFF